MEAKSAGASFPETRWTLILASRGSPERVVDELQRLREEMFLDYLLCAPLSHSSFMMFTEQVLPRLL